MSQTLGRQILFTGALQSAATANGNGQSHDLAGLAGPLIVQIDNTDAAGSGTVLLQGSFDNVNWFALGYQQIDSIAAPSRAVVAFSVAAATHHVYQVLDHYPILRAVLSGMAGFTTGGITVTANGLPLT